MAPDSTHPPRNLRIDDQPNLGTRALVRAIEELAKSNGLAHLAYKRDAKGEHVAALIFAGFERQCGQRALRLQWLKSRPSMLAGSPRASVTHAWWRKTQPGQPSASLSIVIFFTEPFHRVTEGRVGRVSSTGGSSDA